MDKRAVERILNGRKRRPTHPGELLRKEVMPSAGLTQAELARALGVSRKTVSEVVLEQRPVTVDMAVRLGTFFGNGPALWLNMQQAVDLWDTLEANRKAYAEIKPLKRRAA